MTTRTIEVEQTETVEEQFAICDHCGLEATPEDSVTLAPLESATSVTDIADDDTLEKMARDGVPAGRMALVAFDADYDAVHYHTEDCLDRATLGEYEPVRAWSEMEDTHGNRVLLAMAWPEIIITLAGIGLAFGVGAFGPPPTNLLGVMFGIGFVLTGLITGSRQADTPIEELNKR